MFVGEQKWLIFIFLDQQYFSHALFFHISLSIRSMLKLSLLEYVGSESLQLSFVFELARIRKEFTGV